MTVTLPTLTPLEESLWLTLCARALDNRSPHPVLGDATADQIVRALDYDDGKLNLDANLKLVVPLRAKKLDQVAAEFLARHPDAIGLDLGAGLDTRFERLAPPADVDWYDVDLPAVATARERLIPEHPNAHVIGADVRDPDWLDAIPSDRPAMIVADGLMGFLTQDELGTLWNRLVSHFPSGEIVFNSYTRFAIWIAQHARGSRRSPTWSSSPAWTTPANPKAGTPSCTWSGRSCSAGSPRSTSSHRSGAGTTGWPPTAPPGPGWEPSSCTTASEAWRSRPRTTDPRLLSGPASRTRWPGRARGDHAMSAPAQPPARYRIHIQGHLDPAWSAWFDGLTVTQTDDGTTELAGPLADQAALFGVLAGLRDLGATLLLVERLDAGSQAGGRQEMGESLMQAPSEPAGLPAPTGRHRVGRASFDLVDPDRADIYAANPQDRRELVIWTGYPASPWTGGRARRLPARSVGPSRPAARP